MKNLIFICILFFGFQSQSQNKAVKFYEQNIKNTLNIYLINTTETIQEVELELVNLKGLRGDKKPITKQIAPKDTLLFYSFTTMGNYSYNYNIKDTPILDIGEISLDLKINFDEGIIIFYKPDCPRSQRTVAYLLENDFEYKILNVAENKDYPHLMRQLLAEKGNSPKELIYPVVLVNGNAHVNFDIPQSFQKIFD